MRTEPPLGAVTWPPWWPSLRRLNRLIGVGGISCGYGLTADATRLRLIGGGMAGG
jgi:hypothetical protein